MELQGLMDMTVMGSFGEGIPLLGGTHDTATPIIKPREVETSALLAIQNPSFSAFHAALQGPSKRQRARSYSQTRIPGNVEKTPPKQPDGPRLVAAVNKQLGDLGKIDFGNLDDNEISGLAQRILAVSRIVEKFV